MIYDHIKNIGLYKGLTPAIDLALDYIATITPDVEVGSTPSSATATSSWSSRRMPMSPASPPAASALR